jgi:iron complex outermembrane receptor protein
MRCKSVQAPSRLAFLMTSVALAASPALAADAPAAVEEVVVTARRVEENIQKVPVAVTAISAEAVRERGIVSVTDVMFAAPSVQMNTALGGLSGAFSIRGLAGGTQVYFAEIPGGPTESAAPFYDIANVQVLNGPQGTLFGRANTAGAVLVTPARPDLDSLTGSLDVAQGNLDLSRITAVLNVPIIEDELAIRIAAHRNHLDGYTKTLGSSDRLNETHTENARVSAEWRKRWFRTYSVFDYYDVDQAPSAPILSAINTSLPLLNLPADINAPNGLAVGTATFGAVCGQAVAAGLSPNVNACIDQRLRIAATFRPALEAEFARTSQGGDAVRSTPHDPSLDLREKLRKLTFVNQSEIDFGKVGFTTVTLRNIFGFQAAKGATLWNTDGLGGLIQNTLSVSPSAAYAFTVSGQQVGDRVVFGVGPYQKVYTNETQLRGDVGDGLLVWSLGGFYQRAPGVRNAQGVRNMNRVNSGITLATLGYNPSFPFPDGGLTTQRAVNAQGTLDIGFAAPFLTALHVTGGLRKSWDKAEVLSRTALTDIPTGRIIPGAQTRSFTKSDGYNSTLSLDAQVTPRLLVYAATRKGYRPGGVNLGSLAIGLPNFTPTYAPESVRDYELGAKVDFRLGPAIGRLNAAAYSTRYGDIQRTLSASVNNIAVSYIVNAAAARIEGLELQGQLVSGPWNLSVNYAYADARFTDYTAADPFGLIRPGDPRCLPQSTAALCLLDLTDNPFANISRHQGSATLKYDLPIDERLGEASLQATVYMQSRRYFSDTAERTVQQYGEVTRDAISQKGFERINLRADWKRIGGGNVSAALFVNNLTDRNYALTTITQLHSLGNSTKIYGEPRTYGVELRYAFGE